MTRDRADQKKWQAERAQPGWHFWLEYDEQDGWQLMGEPKVKK